MTRNISYENADSPALELEQMVEIAADAGCRFDARGADRLWRQHIGSREHAHLQFMRKLHLAREPFLRHRRPHQPVDLDRGGNLRSDRGHQLLVSRDERIARLDPGEGYNAECDVTLRRRPHDRHSEQTAPTHGCFKGCSRDALLHQHGPVRAEHLRRNACGVVHRNRSNVVGFDPLHRDGTQQPARGIVHQHGCQRRADHLGNRAQDRPRGVFEVHGAAKDLANGIEEVDLLPAAGQLLGGELRLEPCAIEFAHHAPGVRRAEE